MTKADSPRQRLRRFTDSGELRKALQNAHLKDDAVDLAVLVVSRYCEPRQRRRKAR
ncbi:MAG TPA: hypothetical protein VFV82_06195 [Candidatus Binatia bacterium]|nr:hypothetical protein [Candidatus Binatia bacterium]